MITDTHRRVTIRFALPPRGLAPNGSFGFWPGHARAAKAYRTECFWDAVLWARNHEPQAPFVIAEIALAFVYCQTRRLRRYCPTDIDNAIAATKPLRDGLVDAGLLVTDTAQRLRFGSVTISRHARHRSGEGCPGSAVVVTLREVGNAA